MSKPGLICPAPLGPLRTEACGEVLPNPRLSRIRLCQQGHCAALPGYAVKQVI